MANFCRKSSQLNSERQIWTLPPQFRGYTFTFLENRITPCGYYRRRCVPRQSFDRARQYGIRRREWDRRTAHGYIKSMLLRLVGEREMGQNDPPHTDDLSVTERKALRLIEARGLARKCPHHTGRLSVTRYITRVDIVSTWIFTLQMRLQGFT